MLFLGQLINVHYQIHSGLEVNCNDGQANRCFCTSEAYEKLLCRVFGLDNQSIEDGINPIWTGHFGSLKRLGGGGPPPNLSISRQMTMKLSKGILWVEIFTN